MRADLVEALSSNNSQFLASSPSSSSRHPTKWKEKWCREPSTFPHLGLGSGVREDNNEVSQNGDVQSPAGQAYHHVASFFQHAACDLVATRLCPVGHSHHVDGMRSPCGTPKTCLPHAMI